MKKLFIVFIILVVIIGLSFTPKLFSPAASQVAVGTGGGAITGYNSLVFNPSGTPGLCVGSNCVVGYGPLDIVDSINNPYQVQAINLYNGTAAAAGFVAYNNASTNHIVRSLIYSANATGKGDVAEFYSNASGGYWLNSANSPISLKTNSGVIPTGITTTAMNAISSPTDGQQIYNTTTHDYWYYNSSTSAWVEMGSGFASSGSYTPTAANVQYISNTGSPAAYYLKIGNRVHVALLDGVTPSTKNVSPVITFTLPFTANGGYIIGTATIGDSLRVYGAVVSLSGSTKASVTWYNTDLVTEDLKLEFDYISQ